MTYSPKSHTFIFRFCAAIILVCMIIPQTSCKSSASIEIAGIKAYAAEKNSKELKALPLTKFPILYVRDAGEYGAHASSSRIALIHKNHELLLSTHGNSLPVCPNVVYSVDKKGNASIYNQNDKEWSLLVLLIKEEAILVWNRENAGENVHFINRSKPFVYKKLRITPSFKEL